MASSEETRYYEKIKSIQQSMNQSERRRLELERELFTYSRSDKRISQIKASKLGRYLKEICDREAQAKMRNLELQRDVECIEISMKEYRPDHGPLQQQKADFFKKLSSLREAEKKRKVDRLYTAKVEAVHGQQHQDSSVFHPDNDSTDPAAAVLSRGRKTSRGSDAEAGSTSVVVSHQALHRSPNHSPHFCQRLPSGLLKDFRVGGEASAGDGAHLSDDISGSNDSPGGGDLSDKHERTGPVFPSGFALTDAAGYVPFGGEDEQGESPLLTLTGPEKNPSPGSDSLVIAKNSTAEHTESREAAPQSPLMEDGGKSLSPLMPETTFGEEAGDAPGRPESVSTSSSHMQLSESSASDLSVSLTQSEPEEDPSEGVAPEGRASSAAADAHSRHSPDSPLPSEGSKDTPEFNYESSAPVVTSESLSQEALFDLLDHIEGRLGGAQSSVYGDASIDARQLNRIIHLCESGAGLNGEDLEACGAVVVQELQRLSWSTAKGCLLPRDLVCASRAPPRPGDISASLPPDAARLWDRWFKHALLLKERRVLSTRRLVQLFTPLLLERHATYGHQAKVLLRTLVSRSSEEWPSAAQDHSDLSSSSSSLLADAHGEPARPEQEPGSQELQSTEEDSRDESPVESVPIRETKAYQLLKQSAMQKRRQSSEEEEEDDDLSGITHGHEEDLGRAKRSSHQDPYPREEKANPKAHSALQSKAFWGESDDSYSEIEAALRPPSFNTNLDDTDDFFD